MGEQQHSNFGRIAEDGTVYVRTASGERQVGSWQAGTPAEGLAFYARRYDQLVTEVNLLAQRLASGAADPRQVRGSAARLKESLPSASAVGDLDALDARLTALLEQAEARSAAAKAERAERAGQAQQAKEALAAEAEQIAANSTSWKAAGDRLRQIAEEWRSIRGVDRSTDTKLWRRVTAAREEFGKRRSAHFAELDRQRQAVRERKEALVAEAESLSDSTDWAATAARYKSLMADWKAAGRATKEADDALWTRFRAAQDAFFSRRSENFGQRDAAYRDNQAAKERLLAAAEAADPSADADAARRRLRELHEQWERIGRVPREAVAPLEARLRAVEERIRSVADRQWRASTESPFLVRLRESVAELEGKVAKARAAGRETANDEARLAQHRQLLAQAERSR